MPHDPSLIYGLNPSGLDHVSQVRSGLACGCSCPACGGVLVAKKGRRNRHHFAHHDGADCPRATETALHLAAKQILARRRAIMLPAVHLGDGAVVPHAPRGAELFAAERVVLQHVRLEQRVGDVIPDVIAWASGRDLYIEVCVTHEVDEAKRAKLVTRGVSTVEIDLGDAPRTLTPAEIEHRVVDAVTGKTWSFNAAARAARPAALASSLYLPATRYGGVARVDYCPAGARRWGEKSWAAVEADCRACPHAVAIAPQTGDVRCGGRLTGLDDGGASAVRERPAVYATAAA